MERSKLHSLVRTILKKFEKGLVGGVELEDYDMEDGFLYAEFEYMVDDIRASDQIVVENALEEALGEEFGVVIQHMDSFPDGSSSYRIKIDS